MRRRRSTPWIHRWSRVIIAAIAAVGAVGTGYLTITKLAGGSAACPTSGCEQVLSSPYATVFGLPLTLFGFLAYASMGILAIAPLIANSTTNKDLQVKLENWTWPLMLAIGTAMAVFSGYLIYLLAFEIKALCLYCLASALFSISFLVLTVLGRDWEDVGQIFFTGVAVALVTLVGTLGVYANIDGTGKTTASSSGEAGALVTTPSGTGQIALAKHLSQVGAKMYGAYWCPHCNDQKQLFGREGAKQINYIECDPNGQNPQTEVCKAQKIEGYPTWEINGQFYGGTQSLEKLAELSGYQGPKNFQ